MFPAYVTWVYVSFPSATPDFRTPLRENSSTLIVPLKPMFYKFQIITMCMPSSILPRLFPAGYLCKLRALQRTSYPPPPAVNFLPVLHCSVYILIEKLKQYRKYYIIPLALPVKSPSVWGLIWGWAIYYKCHITVVTTFCFLWIILCNSNQGKKVPCSNPSQTFFYFILIDRWKEYQSHRTFF